MADKTAVTFSHLRAAWFKFPGRFQPYAHAVSATFHKHQIFQRPERGMNVTGKGIYETGGSPTKENSPKVDVGRDGGLTEGLLLPERDLKSSGTDGTLMFVSVNPSLSDALEQLGVVMHTLSLTHSLHSSCASQHGGICRSRRRGNTFIFHVNLFRSYRSSTKCSCNKVGRCVPSFLVCSSSKKEVSSCRNYELWGMVCFLGVFFGACVCLLLQKTDDECL